MTISKKGKRKIVVGGRSYLWWVGDRFDPEFNSGSCTALTVLSADGHFLVRFFLGQASERRFLIVLGPEFQGLPEAGGPWIRIRCPEWQGQPSSITPVDVRHLIEWCATADKELIRVNYLGRSEVLPALGAKTPTIRLVHSSL